MSCWILFKFKYYILVVPVLSALRLRCIWAVLRISFSFFLGFVVVVFFNNPLVFVYCLFFFFFFVCNSRLMWCSNKMMKCFPFYFHQKIYRVLLLLWFFFYFYFDAHSFLSFAFLLAWLDERSQTVLCVCARSHEDEKKTNYLIFSSNKAWHAPVHTRIKSMYCGKLKA